MEKTKKLYDNEPYGRIFTAQILSAEKKKDVWEIALDRTLFFPEEGGQSADTGQIILPWNGADIANVVTADANVRGEAGADVDAAVADATGAGAAVWQVTDVQIRDGIICHRIKKSGDTPDRVRPQLHDGGSEDSGIPCPGMTVRGQIDWPHRFSNMQNHTGEHIISGLIHAKYGFDNVGFHLSRNVVTLDQNGYLTPEQAAEIEWEANRAVWADLPVSAAYLSPAEAAKKSYRSKIEINGDVRLVTIGSPPLHVIDVCACCAPHVRRTGEIGLIKILRSEKYKGGTRLTILCGDRALEAVRRQQTQLEGISHLLRAKQEEACEAVRHLFDENASQKERLVRMQEEKIRRLAERANFDGENIWIFTEDLDPLPHRNLVNLLMEKCGGYAGAFLLMKGDAGYRFIIGSRTLDCREAAGRLREQFGARGGGKPEMVQGSVTAAYDELKDFLGGSL